MIGVVTVIIVVVIAILIASVMFSNNYQSPVNVCNAGECPTNLLSGVKRCSIDPTERIKYNPKYEVCNSQNLCDNPLTPFAELESGATIDNGVCVSEGCNCRTARICNNWNVVAFKDDGTSISQIPLSGTRELQPGYTCDMHVSTIQGINCPITGETPEEIEANLRACSALYPECGQLPLCKMGYLAITNEGLSSRYTCVADTPCTCGQASILDHRTGNITCVNV